MVKLPTRVLGLLLAVFCVGCDPHADSGSLSSMPDAGQELAAELLSSLMPARVPVSELGRKHPVEERMAHHRVPGFGMAVIEHDQVVWEGGHGQLGFGESQQIQPQTAFQAASLSKAVAAFGALVMVQRGLLDLDVPVNRYLGSWTIPDDDQGQADSITMAHLLSHTAALTVHGFPGYASSDPLPTTSEVLDGSGPANTDPVRIDGTVGEAFRYSGGGYTVAELVMEEVSGKGLAELMQELVLEPLGMQHSSFQQPATKDIASRAAPAIDGRGERLEDVWHVYPEQAAAGLWTTPGDYARFILGIAAALQGSEQALISRELARRMTSPIKGGYGFGVAIDGEGESVVLRHGGSNYGYKCAFAYSPHRHAGIVVMTSADNGMSLASEIIASAQRRFGFGDPEQEGIEVKPLPEGYQQLAGDWYIETHDVRFRIFSKDDRLWIANDSSAPGQLYSLGDDAYRTMEQRAVYTASRDEAGHLDTLVLTRDGQQIAVATRAAE